MSQRPLLKPVQVTSGNGRKDRRNEQRVARRGWKGLRRGEHNERE
jgi:hypothetical protein